MAKNSQPWDLNPILEAFLKSMEGKATDENFDELSLRIKDLNGLFKDLIQFFKTQGLYNKELGDVIKKAVEFEKAQTKSRKGQGISQDTAHLYISQELSKYFALSARGKSGAFDVNSKNDLIKAMKDNLSAYDKLVTSVNDLQKTITDAVNALGGKLGQSMGGSNKKDPSGGGFLGLFGAATGKGSSTKDPDLKSAAPKGNPFMKGIGTLIGFLGNMGGNGFLGRLKKAISEFFVQAGLDVLRLAAYGLLSLVRNFGPGVLKPFKWITMGGKVLFGSLGRAVTKGVSSAFRAMKNGKAIAGVMKAAGTGLKQGAKWGAKTAAKKIPGLSIGAGLAFGAMRLAEGDKLGALLETVSGIAGSLGPWGMAVSLLIDVGLGIRDFFNWKKKKDTALGESITRANKDLEDRDNEKKGFWENFCNWIKDHWGLLAGYAMGGPTGATIGAIYDHIKNKDKGTGAPEDNSKYKSKIIGGQIIPDFDERKKEAGKYYNERMSKEISFNPFKYKQNLKLKEKILKETEEKYGVRLGALGTIGAQDLWTEENLKSNPSNANITSGVSASASLNNIGAGQSYKAPSTGGSVLGDAFFGGNLSRISTGGGFGGSRGHKGIDLPYPEGTTVRAFLPGKFEYMSDNLGGFGKVIGIRDDRGMMNIYAHLSHINKNLYGKKIQRGQEIGRSGSTGYSVTGSKPGSKVEPHLHFEVRPSMAKGGSINPVAHVASALGYSVDSLPDSGPMFADAEPSMDSSRSASAPKGVYNEEGDVVASAGEGGTSIAEELKNAYANNGFDQTGNTQFLAAINSIRVQLGKYQQIGMVTGG